MILWFLMFKLVREKIKFYEEKLSNWVENEGRTNFAVEYRKFNYEIELIIEEIDEKMCHGEF